MRVLSFFNFLFFFIFNFSYLIAQQSDHEKAIEAVKNEEILPLDQILLSINSSYEGRVLAINLKDSEQGLFGWVYDIRMINSENKVINLRVDAGTSTVLMVDGIGN